MHYYQWHLKDYRASTAHLTNEQDLAYRRLLDMYYDTEQPLSLDTEWLALRIRCAVADVAFVLRDMFLQTDAGYSNARADAELERMHRRAAASRANGMQGGRKQTKQEPARMQPDTHTGLLLTSTTDAIDSRKRRRPSDADGTDAAFEAFWVAYDKKLNRADARKAWQQLAPDVVLAKTIVDRAAAWSRMYRAKPNGTQYQPYPGTWLRARRWEDQAMPDGKPWHAAEHEFSEEIFSRFRANAE